jgi:hypothetical protein|nr:MAG TPA: hypothetical protein [Caudoviricetes sp.]
MTRQQIKFIFNEIKREAKLDFALTKGYCCQTCTWADIEDEYGKESKGIWLKYFDKGMNRQKWNGNEPQYIAHELASEQKEIVYNILSQHFKVEWENMSDDKCIIIKNKGE